PNIIPDIVIGGVLAATFVPIFVDRLATRTSHEAWRAISAITTVTLVLLVAATIAFWFLTPTIIDVYTVTNHTDVVQQRHVAVDLLRWFIPQLACYGLIGLFTALLNARGKFAAPMFVAIANNVVVITVLLWFHALLPHPSLESVTHQRGALVLLGLGTTLGVVVQAALLIPSLRRAKLHVRFHWEPTHEAVRTIVRLAGWTFAFVVTSQIALVIILALADGVRPPGQVTAYTYAYTFFQLPFGVVAVSVMSAVTPSLATRWALRDTAGFRERLAFGMRGMLAIIIPSAVGMVILARPLIDLILVHGSETLADGASTASALAMFSLGLPGFCLYLYAIRALQSMQDTRTAFFLSLVENGVNVVAGVALVGPLGVRGLALSISIAYTVAAVVALGVLRSRIGTLGGGNLTRPLKRVAGASLVMAVVTALAVSVSGATHGIGLLARVAFALVAGTGAYVATASIAGARESRTRAARRSGPPTAAGPGLSPPVTFRDRLEGEASAPPARHLRPVRKDPEGDKEDSHGPDTGGDR
ncbi:MAG: murein biosynthesis integral membrane protein MurJ, partial [Acidimicrobiales bacterium]